ncbi:MAG: hypothetical protein KME43_18770 [Myxacorys chilensis ATA2-1-KO14]|jgi:hypothetical protein|nr:hypothetical protein [Myxacorys chilensis ATA2-1-KO14]
MSLVPITLSIVTISTGLFTEPLLTMLFISQPLLNQLTATEYADLIQRFLTVEYLKFLLREIDEALDSLKIMLSGFMSLRIHSFEGQYSTASVRWSSTVEHPCLCIHSAVFKLQDIVKDCVAKIRISCKPT